MGNTDDCKNGSKMKVKSCLDTDTYNCVYAIYRWSSLQLLLAGRIDFLKGPKLNFADAIISTPLEALSKVRP